MPSVSGSTGLVNVAPAPIRGYGEPQSSFKPELGQVYFDVSQNPPVEYVFNGVSWLPGGGSPATTTLYGTVILTDNSEPVATKLYADNLAIAGAPAWSESVSGIGQLSTAAEAIAGTDDNTAITPLKLADVLAAGVPIVAGAITATTIHATGLITGDASATITTGATALNLASDASTGAVNIGTGAGARAITLGNVTTSTAVTVNTGTGGFNVNTTSTGDVVMTSADTMLLDSVGVMEINSSAGVIGIGNDAVAQNINIGTGAAQRIITIGNSTSATSVVINAGTGPINIGTSAFAKTITIGNQTGASALVLDSGTGPITIGTTIAKVITIGNTTGVSGTTISVGSGNFVLDGVAGSTYGIGASTTTGTITIGGSAQAGTVTLVSSTAANSLLLQNGINVGAQITSINNGATASTSTVNILSGAGSAGAALLHLADNPRVTTISLANVAPAAARSTAMFGGNSAQNDAVTMWAGNPSAGTQSLSVFGGIASGGTQTISLMNGTQSAGTQSVNILSGITTGTAAGTFNLGTAAGILITSNINTGASAHILNIGNAASGAQTWDVGTGNFTMNGGGNSILIGNDVATNTITIGGGAAAANTISIGGTGANVVAIANTQTGGSLSLAHAMTTGNIVIGDAQIGGTFTIGSTGAGVGTVRIFDGSGAQTITMATGAAAKTITIGSTNTSSVLVLNAGSGDVKVTGANLRIATAGKGLQQKSGAATDMCGTAILVLGTLTIANTNIATGDLIFLSRVASNGSVTLGVLSYTISNGTSFTINSLTLGTPAAVQAADVSSVAYFIVRPL